MRIASPHFSQNFVARRSERLSAKAGAVEDAGLGEYILLKNETSPTQAGRRTASRSRNSVRIGAGFESPGLFTVGHSVCY